MAEKRAAKPRPANAGEASDADAPPTRLVASPLARAPLAAAAAAYSLVVRARNGLFDAGLLRAHSVPARVVSVGNVVAGGTGKTPVVAFLARVALERGRRVAILSRGYGRCAGDALNDEGRLLAAKLPEALVIEDRDRVAAARRAVALGKDLLLLDDGLQHRRLRRDADVVLVDATRAFEDERLLPLGFLREPSSSALRRATVALLTRAELATPERLEALRASVEKWCERIAVAETVVTGLARLSGKEPAEGPAFLFAGIGNPSSFRRTAERAGIDVVGFRAFRDHHPYERRDMDLLLAEGAAAGAARFVTTEKDAVKLGGLLPEGSGGPSFQALEIGVRLRANENSVLAALFGGGVTPASRLRPGSSLDVM